jgi:putative SOS response-associated peptidase YedK
VEEWIDQDHFYPRYNIAPHSHAPVLRRGQQFESNHSADSSDDGSNLVLHTMKWGLIPSWSKHEDKSLNTTNARSENLIQGGGMWNSIKGRKRCAVVCQGCTTVKWVVVEPAYMVTQVLRMVEERKRSHSTLHETPRWTCHVDGRSMGLRYS